MEIMKQYAFVLFEAEFIHNRISENIHLLTYLQFLYWHNTVNCTHADLHSKSNITLYQESSISGVQFTIIKNIPMKFIFIRAWSV